MQGTAEGLSVKILSSILTIKWFATLFGIESCGHYNKVTTLKCSDLLVISGGLQMHRIRLVTESQ